MNVLTYLYSIKLNHASLSTWQCGHHTAGWYSDDFLDRIVLWFDSNLKSMFMLTRLTIMHPWLVWIGKPSHRWWHMIHWRIYAPPRLESCAIDLYGKHHLYGHYCDVIMGPMASQIISLTIVYSTVHSGADQGKHQSSASLAFAWGIHRWPVNSSGWGGLLWVIWRRSDHVRSRPDYMCKINLHHFSVCNDAMNPSTFSLEQIVGYVMACRSYSFVCTLHHIIIIIVQTYL